MESRFGHDFGQVRVHTDTKAAESARAVHALAYTIGRNVVFGANKYAPKTHIGRRLLAHELAHTIQQGQATSGSAPLRVSSPNDSAEREARASAEAWTVGRAGCPQQRTGPMVQRDEAKSDRRTFIVEGFTGRETEDEARLIAASKGWVVEGTLRWNGRNWIGENVRKGTGKEKAVAQVQLDLLNLEDVGEALGIGEDLGTGFEEGQSIYTGEEPTYTREFGQGESESGEAEEGEGKEGKAGDKPGETGSKEKAEGMEGTGTGTGTNELDPLTALASLMLDPESLAEGKKNTTGEQGSPAGGIGFITGGLAKFLTVLAAALSLLTGPILKLFGKIKDLGKRALSSLADKLRGLRGASSPKALPKALPPAIGYEAPKQPLRSPSRRHTATGVTQGTTTKEVNTVIKPGVDVAGDVAAINKGLAKRVGNTFEINGRVYGFQEGHLFPISGNGFVQLNRGAFKALGVFNKFGNTQATRGILGKMRNVGAAEIKAAFKVWRSLP